MGYRAHDRLPEPTRIADFLRDKPAPKPEQVTMEGVRRIVREELQAVADDLRAEADRRALMREYEQILRCVPAALIRGGR